MSRVVLLHGFGGSPRTFDAVHAALGATVDVETPILGGHAGSAAEVDSFENEVDRLAAVIAPEPAPLLVGYSLGGRLAMGLVVRHPDRWRAALFIGAQAGIVDSAARSARRQIDARWAMMLRTDGLDRFLTAWEAQPLFASQVAADPTALSVQAAERRRQDPLRLARSIERLSPGTMPCWDDGLAAATLPMTYLAGARDEKFVGVGQRLAARVVSLTLSIVPDVGHNVPLEAPALTAAAILALAARSKAAHV